MCHFSLGVDVSACIPVRLIHYLWYCAMGWLWMWCGVVDGEKLALQICIHLDYPVFRPNIYSTQCIMWVQYLYLDKTGFSIIYFKALIRPGWTSGC